MLVSLPVVTGRRHRRALRVFACRIDTLTLTRLMVAFIHELHVSCIIPVQLFPARVSEPSGGGEFPPSVQRLPRAAFLGYLA